MNYTMSKMKLLSIAVIGLLLLNFGTLGFVLLRKPPHGPEGRPEAERGGPKNIIIERLHFDKEQVSQYETLIKEHQQTISALRDSISMVKHTLYQTLNNEQANDKDSLVNRLSSLQKEIELTHYKHFTVIKKICKPEQFKLFSNLTNELADFFAPEKNKPMRPED